LFIEYIEHFIIFEGPVYVPKYPPTGWVPEWYLIYLLIIVRELG
jgi:hypothetical protein